MASMQRTIQRSMLRNQGVYKRAHFGKDRGARHTKEPRQFKTERQWQENKRMVQHPLWPFRKRFSSKGE